MLARFEKDISALECLRQSQWNAIHWLGEHELLAEDYFDDGRGARWVLGQHGTFIHRCEIIAGIGGSLVVHGDFDVVRYGHYGDHGDAFRRLCWLGLCTDVAYYVAQKASIGMGRHRNGVENYNEDVARYDLRELRREAEKNDEPELAEHLSGALLYTETERDLRDALSDGDKWDLWERSFGRVLDAHVVISHVALNRTACLLIERHGNSGPAQCRRADTKERAA